MYEFKVELFTQKSLEWLRKETSLNEEIDYNCTFITAYKNKKMVGLIGINFNKRIPQLEHTLIIPKFQKTLLLVALLRRMESYIKEHGYNGYVSFILNTNERMIRYAEKWGMKKYKEEENGCWYAKQL